MLNIVLASSSAQEGAQHNSSQMEENQFDDLVWSCIISFLDLEDNLSMSLTCKRMEVLTKDNRQWVRIILQRVDGLTKRYQDYAIESDVHHLYPFVRYMEDMKLVADGIGNSEMVDDVTTYLESVNVKEELVAHSRDIYNELHRRSFRKKRLKQVINSRRWIRANIRPCMWMFVLMFFCTIVFITSIIAPLGWDNILPNDGYWWIVPYAGLMGFVIIFLFAVLIEILLTGWVPCLSVFRYLFKKSMLRYHDHFETSHNFILNYFSYWCDPNFKTKMEDRILVVMSLHLMYIPMFIVCFGLNQLFFTRLRIFSFIILPVYLCFVLSILDFVRRLIMYQVRAVWHEKIVHVLIILNLGLIYLGVSVSLGMGASKADEHPWMRSKSWGYIFIPFDIAMAVVVLNVSCCRMYFIVHDAKYRQFSCCDWLKEVFYAVLLFFIASLLFLSLILVAILLPLKLDQTVDISFTLAVSPIPIGILVALAFGVCMVACVCCLACFTDVSNEVPYDDFDPNQ